MVEQQAERRSPTSPALLQFIVLLAYLAPLCYAGTILALIVHEIVGHGVVALALGGKFSGFVIRLDATGLAHAWPARGSPVWHEVVVLAGGAVSTTVFGAAFLICALRLRNNHLLRIALAVLAACFVLNGSFYMLWNAWHPQPPGDVGRIVQLTVSQALRWSIFALGIVLTAIFIIVPMAIVVRESGRRIAHGTVVRGWHKALMPIVIGVGLAAGLFIRDWNHMALGIGKTPNYWGIVFGMITTAVLLRVPQDVRPLNASMTGLLRAITASWIMTGVLIFSVLIWLQNGMHW